jgi:hypothetical protein
MVMLVGKVWLNVGVVPLSMSWESHDSLQISTCLAAEKNERSAS